MLGFYLALGALIIWVVIMAPPRPFQREMKRMEKEEKERIDRKPNTLEPHEDPWHSDYRGPKV